MKILHCPKVLTLLALVGLLPFLALSATAPRLAAAYVADLQEVTSPTPEQVWEWVEVPAPYDQDDAIRACDFISPDDGWAVGSDGIILHWDGQEWVIFKSPRPGVFTSLYDVQMLASDNVWAMGEMGHMIHWNGGKWDDVSLSTEYDLTNFSLLSDDFGFASAWYSVNLTNKRNMFQWEKRMTDNWVAYRFDVPIIILYNQTGP